MLKISQDPLFHELEPVIYVFRRRNTPNSASYAGLLARNRFGLAPRHAYMSLRWGPYNTPNLGDHLLSIGHTVHIISFFHCHRFPCVQEARGYKSTHARPV